MKTLHYFMLCCGCAHTICIHGKKKKTVQEKDQEKKTTNDSAAAAWIEAPGANEPVEGASV